MDDGMSGHFGGGRQRKRGVCQTLVVVVAHMQVGLVAHRSSPRQGPSIVDPDARRVVNSVLIPRGALIRRVRRQPAVVAGSDAAGPTALKVKPRQALVGEGPHRRSLPLMA